jgi:hypothetical protein
MGFVVGCRIICGMGICNAQKGVGQIPTPLAAVSGFESTLGGSPLHSYLVKT